MGGVAPRRPKAYKDWNQGKDDNNLLAVVTSLAKDFAKEEIGENNDDQQFGRQDLVLIFFEYVTA